MGGLITGKELPKQILFSMLLEHLIKGTYDEKQIRLWQKSTLFI